MILGAQDAVQQNGSGMSSMLILGLMFLAMWFLLIAPQRKRQKQHTQMLNGLKVGDTVITSGGIYGTVSAIKEERLVIKIADNTKIEVNRAFVQARVDADTKVQA